MSEADPTEQGPDARALRRLLHDVAKYIARTARNVAPGEAPPEALVPLLLKDVYALDGARPASAVFDERAAQLCVGAGAMDERLSEVARLLARADSLEGAARAGEEPALRELVGLAMEVASKLESLVADARGNL